MAAAPVPFAGVAEVLSLLQTSGVAFPASQTLDSRLVDWYNAYSKQHQHVVATSPRKAAKVFKSAAEESNAFAAIMSGAAAKGGGWHGHLGTDAEHPGSLLALSCPSSGASNAPSRSLTMLRPPPPASSLPSLPPFVVPAASDRRRSRSS